MIDKEVFEAFTPDVRHHLESCLSTLATYGVFKMQEEILIKRIVTGFVGRSTPELATEIETTQSKITGLRAMQLLGESLKKEQTT